MMIIHAYLTHVGDAAMEPSEVSEPNDLRAYFILRE